MVAFVDVELTVTKFVIVLVALFARMPPLNVESPVSESVPPIEVLFETVSCDMDAVFVTERYVVVAFVDVAFTMVRLVIVEVLPFTRMTGVVIVPVAVMFADEIFPDTRIFPCTERSVLGVFVPSPKNPCAFTVRS